MQDKDFEWDDDKAAHNILKHGVTFVTAREAFGDPTMRDWFDGREDYGEDRYGALGMTRDGLVFVAFTLRDGRIRIISARTAEPYERWKYHEEES
jgi:uncharacterized DUF497 family protein